jgi:flagellar basal body-associated protein FliL
MAQRGLWFCAFFLLICSLSAFADDDPSGSISVEVRRLDNQLSTITIIVLAVVVMVALALSLYLLFTSRRHGHVPKRIVDLKGPSPVVKHDDYYTAVFSKPLPEEDIVDEKSPPAGFIKEGMGKAEDAVERKADFERYLKEDERIVINVLRMKGNSCSQATLRVVTDFSKARLSRLLAELESRGIVTKVQDGRRNMVTLKV